MKGFASRFVPAALIVAGLITVAAEVQAADLSLPVSGTVLGSVVDASGIPQMGATVQLFNKFERLVAKTSTTADGRFAFDGLPTDLYSIRVSLADFLPVSRDRIVVRAGLDSILQIHLATLLSSIQVSYTFPSAAMSNDWKWVLRSSPATRPITRLVAAQQSASDNPEIHPQIFSGTKAMLSLSGGDGSLIDADSAPGGFGTGFVLSTSILGKNQVQVGGSVAQASPFSPAAMGLCAIYSRDESGDLTDAPEVTLTMSQLGLVSGTGLNGSPGFGSAWPSVRTMSLSVYQVIDPVSSLHVEYGMTGESVSYLQTSTRISPFARATVKAGKIGEVIASYSDGGRPDELRAHQQGSEPEAEAESTDELASAVNTLSRLPQLSYSNGRLELQRTSAYEMGVQKTVATETYSLSAFYEDVSNGRINVAGDTSVLDAGDLMSDGISATSVLNIGRYRRHGMIASMDQRLGDSFDLSLAYGRLGGFTAAGGQQWGVEAAQAEFLQQRMRNAANVTINAKIPKSGTKIDAHYGWLDDGSLVPRHMFTTQNTYIAPGLNLFVRQPLPSLFGMPGHLELTADLRNLLAQGYIPINTGSGRTLLIVQSPRAIRGGLNFVF